MNKKTANLPILKKSFLYFIPLSILFISVATLFYLKHINEKKKIIKLKETHNVQTKRDFITIILKTISSDLLTQSANQDLKPSKITGKRRHEKRHREALEKELFMFATLKGLYDQVRFLDDKGMEVIRINYNKGNAEAMPVDKLQSKSGRYYFNETFNLNKGEVYISPFDLNMEHGKIEKPLKPIIRLGTPIFNEKGKREGVLILNFLGSNIINIFKDTSFPTLGQPMLLNSSGYWLSSPTEENEWGFFIEERKERTFGNNFPKSWETIYSEASGQFVNNEGMFTYQTVYPYNECKNSVKHSDKPLQEEIPEEICLGDYWKIVSHISNDVFFSALHKDFKKFLLLCFFIVILVFMVSYFIARSAVTKKRADEDNRVIQIKMVAASKMATLGEIATGIAHEINQPLTYISALLQGLKLDIKDNTIDFEELKGELDISYRQIERINSIIKHLRTFGRTDDSDKKTTGMETVVNNTILLMGESIRLRNLELTTNIEPDLPTISGNPNQLEQVLINLLQNAMDAFSEVRGDSKRSIGISLALKNRDSVVLEVRDNGSGIDKESIHKIFDPFFTTKEVGKGTGLGLSIAYGIIRDHNGTLSCESEPDKGAVFTIVLPVAGG